MVNQLLDQLLSVVSWGKLDYLILDMPPGTGDIQLSLTQRLNLTAAVIVTTPQELSFADVVRGIEMFDSVNVPSIAVVENMAYYESQPDSNIDTNKLTSAILDTLQQSSIIVESNRRMKELAKQLVDVVMQQQQSSKIEIFGSGHKKRLAEQFGIEHTFSIPLLSSIAKNGDSGTPFILEHPDSPQASVFKDLAKAVVSEVAKVKFNTVRPQINYNADAHVLEVQEHKEHHKLLPADLRRECRCASCVEELTGRQILVKSSIPDKVKPLKLYPTGNYALSVDWSDGHRSLYPYRQIRSLLKEKKTPDNQNKVMTSSERSVVYNRSY
jgi:MinD-like ATPase involved in chromosome partitioning or flagellar assembly